MLSFLKQILLPTIIPLTYCMVPCSNVFNYKSQLIASETINTDSLRDTWLTSLNQNADVHNHKNDNNSNISVSNLKESALSTLFHPSSSDEIQPKCRDIYDDRWFEPSWRLRHLFNGNNYSVCAMHTVGDGNCLYNAISPIITCIDNRHKLIVPAPTYDVTNKFKQMISRIIRSQCKEYTPKCLKYLAAIDFIGVNFEDREDLAQFDNENFIEKLELYKQAYVGAGKDLVDLDPLIAKLRKNPMCKNAYRELFDQLTQFKSPLHWGNEADIASLEKIFNIKFIICHDNGTIFSVPTYLSCPQFVSFLHYSEAHYSTAALFAHVDTKNDKKHAKRIYYDMHNIPEFLKSCLN